MLAWGANGSGQATVAAGLAAVTAVAAGTDHNLALKADGTVAAWGDNSYGQATMPAGINAAAQVAASEKHSLVLLADGTLLFLVGDKRTQYSRTTPSESV